MNQTQSETHHGGRKSAHPHVKLSPNIPKPWEVLQSWDQADRDHICQLARKGQLWGRKVC